MIALSTDKSASSINLYGATKLASDKLFAVVNNMVGQKRTRFVCVRYGNVVGSRGSVVPYFKKLVADGVEKVPITHNEMTRFWMTLQQGVDFVLKNFERMHGGEIFVPKIPSVKILDLVEAYAPESEVSIIGIRPGEKLHEIMCPADDSHLTLEFANHYVITPSITFTRSISFETNAIGEQGIPVAQGFEYNSGSNNHFLTIDELRMMN